MIRQFRIIGLDTGEEISLNDFNKYLLTLPEGLGVEYKNTFITIGTQRIKVSQERDYKSFSGTIEVCGNTRDDWEKNYNSLRDFVAKNLKSGIKLYYKNRADDERYILCDIKLMTKTEKSSYCILVPVAFEPRSIWKKDVEVNTNISAMAIEKNTVAFLKDENFSVNDQFRFNYGFLYDENLNQHDIRYMSSETGSAQLINNADAETPVKLTIYGACINPYIQLINSNGEEEQACRIYATLSEGDKIILNSDPADLSIIVVRANGMTDVITNNIDTSLTTFLTLPIGSYTVKIREENNNLVNGNIKYSLQFIGG